jgi:hypothetical protein
LLPKKNRTATKEKKEEKEIHNALKERHFELEWFELTDDQYAMLFNDFHFQDYSEDERAVNLKLARIQTKARSFDLYHVFKKPKKDRAGKRFYRWYYYFYDQSGKKIQKACRGCRTRLEAENFVSAIPAEVN